MKQAQKITKWTRCKRLYFPK